jgi:hypothetical protein
VSPPPSLDGGDRDLDLVLFAAAVPAAVVGIAFLSSGQTSGWRPFI